MKAIILSGCTRKNGKTVSLVNKFIDGLKESGYTVDLVDSTKVKVHPCIGCLNCEKTGKCIIRDDMDKIYQSIIDADLIVLASPVYFASVTAQLKAIIDRCQTLYSKRFILKESDFKPKKGYLIFTAGLKNTKQIDALELLTNFFMLSCNGKLEKSIYAMNTDSEDISLSILEESYLIGKRSTL